MQLEDALALVEVARLAPSGDNLQPFCYRLDAATATLEVRLDVARAAHVLDRAGHASRLTLGMVLRALEVAAESRGQRVEVALTPAALSLGPIDARRGPAMQTWARVRLRAHPDPAAAAAASTAALQALAERHTDRRIYRAETASAPARAAGAAVREALAAMAEPGVHVGLRAPTPGPGRAWLERADAALWHAPAIPADALRWVRFDPRELAASGDGVSWRNLGLPPALAAGVAVARRAPVALRLGAHLGGPWMTGRMLAAQLDSSELLVTVATADAAPATLVRAGHVALRAWARLCAAGWSAQPLTLAPILTMTCRDGVVPPGIPRWVAEQAQAGFVAARRDLGLPLQSWPAFVLRAGPNAPLPNALRPPRRSAQALLAAGHDGGGQIA